MTLILALGLLFLTTALVAAWAIVVHTPDDDPFGPLPDDVVVKLRDGRLS
jgi:hypothetical protein